MAARVLLLALFALALAPTAMQWAFAEVPDIAAEVPAVPDAEVDFEEEATASAAHVPAGVMPHDDASAPHARYGASPRQAPPTRPPRA